MTFNIKDVIEHGPRRAEAEVEVIVGADRLVRLNVDGECVYRVRLGPDAQFVVRDDTKPPPPPLKAV